MNDCIFCKIIEDKLPAYKVYEDEKFMAFLDIAPVNPGHTLVVPKKHFVSLSDVPKEYTADFMTVVKKVGDAVMEAVGVEGFNLGMNNGGVAGQIVPHVHMHIMPRVESDGLKLWPSKKYSPGEDKQVAQKIRQALGQDHEEN